MLQSTRSSAGMLSVVNSVFQARITDYKLILKGWYGNLFFRSIFNIKAGSEAEYTVITSGGKKKKMKITRHGRGKVRTPYSVPLEGKTLGAIARHYRVKWNVMRRHKQMATKIPKLSAA